MIQTYGNQIAVEAPENTGMKRENIGGVSLPVHRASLAQLKVVFGNERIKPESIIYVYRALLNEKWAQAVHEIDGKKIIFVPEMHVLLVGVAS